MNGSFRKILLLSAVVALLNPAPSHAGFWNRTPPQELMSAADYNASVDYSYLQSNGIAASEAFSAKDFSALNTIAQKKTLFQKFSAIFSATRVPSRGVAIAMAMLDLIVPFGFARFVMGYGGKGAAQAALFAIGVAGAVLVATSFWEPEGMMFLPGVLMISMGIFSYVWQLIDNIRILANKLIPKAGYWRPKRPLEP
jgi:TM2 domain-containing membrane protein YozV